MDAPWLIIAAMFRSAFDSRNITLDQMRRVYKVKQIKGKIVDFDEVLTKQPISWMHREMAALGKG